MMYKRMEPPLMRRVACSTKNRNATPHTLPNRIPLPLLRSRLFLCVLHALVVILCVIHAQPPLCNAAVIHPKAETIGMEEESTSQSGKLVELQHCVPDIIFYESNLNYNCYVTDLHLLNDKNIWISFYEGDSLNGGWKATVDRNKHSLSFVPSGRASPGMNELVVTAYNEGAESIRFPVSETLIVEFMDYTSTRTTFTALFPYYGMKLEIDVNFPVSSTPSDYLLVKSMEDCKTQTGSCNNNEGCYVMKHDMKLPPHGTYYLCVTADRWDNMYIPWGRSFLRAKALVLTPFYFAVGATPSIKLYDSDTYDIVNDIASSIYIVKCNRDTCPLVKNQGGEEIVSLDVCSSRNHVNQVNILDGNALLVTPGSYALCVEKNLRYESPVVHLVDVVQKPFSMKGVGRSGGFVSVQVSGGDIGHRRDKYGICIMERGVSCNSVDLAETFCSWSTTPNVDVIDVAVGVSASQTKLTFCLIVQMTYNTKKYLDVLGEMEYDPDDDIYTTTSDVIEPGKEWIWILVLCLCLFVFLLLLITGITLFMYYRKKSNNRSVSGAHSSRRSSRRSSSHSDVLHSSRSSRSSRQDLFSLDGVPYVDSPTESLDWDRRKQGVCPPPQPHWRRR